ncbi:Replication Protein, partial [Candidatus Magnetomorum sp. HK-1]
HQDRKPARNRPLSVRCAGHKTRKRVGDSPLRCDAGFNVGPRLAVWMVIDPKPETDIVYIDAKGETTPKVVEAIRREFPGHSAPRLDVCEDYDEPGAFERLQAIVRACKGPKVKGGYIALPDDSKDGRTWAAGTRGGVGYLRVYEAGKHPDRVHLGRPN